MKHCWHEVGPQMDPCDKCCWCGKPKLDSDTSKHGNALGFQPTEQINRTNEDCPRRGQTFDQWDR